MTLMQLIFWLAILGLLLIVIFVAWTRWLAGKQWVRDELAQRYGTESLRNHGGVEAELSMIQIEPVIDDRPSAQVISLRGKHSYPQMFGVSSQKMRRC